MQQATASTLARLGNSPPWAADLKDDVKNINGRSRNYLLAAWYRHAFLFGDGSTLGASAGILDSTDYLDGNAYANDEYTQFMSQAFVNSGNYALPSHDAGAALEWTSGAWAVSAIGMNIGENEDGNNFRFWGIQASYQAETPLGTGGYRFIVVGTSPRFLDPSATEEKQRLAWGSRSIRIWATSWGPCCAWPGRIRTRPSTTKPCTRVG